MIEAEGRGLSPRDCGRKEAWETVCSPMPFLVFFFLLLFCLKVSREWWGNKISRGFRVTAQFTFRREGKGHTMPGQNWHSSGFLPGVSRASSCAVVAAPQPPHQELPQKRTWNLGLRKDSPLLPFLLLFPELRARLLGHPTGHHPTGECAHAPLTDTIWTQSGASSWTVNH